MALATYLIQFRESKKGIPKRAIVDTIDGPASAINEAKARYGAKVLIGCQLIHTSVRHIYLTPPCKLIR